MFDSEFTGELIGYARTSREDQNLDLQLMALKEAGIKEDFIFKEKISSLAKKRPQYELALKRCRSGDCLVVWKLDRLGRSALGLINTVNELKARGVNFKSLTQPFDTTTPMGTMVFGLMALLAQLERDLTAERTAEGIKAAKERGTYKTRGLTFDKALWDKMCEIYKNDDDNGIAAIARKTGLSYQTVYRYFKDIKQGLEFYIRFPYEEQNQ